MKTWDLVTVSAAILSLAAPVLAQPWSVEELRDRTPGFHQGSSRAKLRQIAELIVNKEDVFESVCATIQGDHREYILKIERLLDRLADDRWAVREDAERQLIEIGARAMTLIEQRRESGATLEERIRSARIEREIAGRGTEEEEAAIRLLRGLVEAARYLDPSPRLANSLISAAGHTDPTVVDGAMRALGFVGDGDAKVAPFLAKRLSFWSRQHVLPRRTILGALTRLGGAGAVDALLGLVEADALTRDELLGVLVDVRAQPDGGVRIVARLESHPDPVVAAAARLALPAEGDAPAPTVSVSLGDRTEFEGPLLALRSDGVEIGQVEGLDRVYIAKNRCSELTFGGEARPLAEGSVRLFTIQGSLLVGRLLGMTDAVIELESPVFGVLSLARSEVQGIAVDPDLDRLIGASTAGDRLRLRGGEVVDGTVRSISDAGIDFLGDDGAERVVAMDRVEGVLMQRPPAANRSSSESFTKVELATGDRLLVHLAAAVGGRIGFVMDGVGSAVVPFTMLRRLEFGVGGGAMWGFTLVADYSENAVFELDDRNNVVFRLDEMYRVWDAECLDNGHLLVVEFALGRVVEMKRDRTEVWSFDDLKNPYDADRLPNGNTLIADTYGYRVIEVDREGKIVWSYDDSIKPLDVERLANGNTLIADDKQDRIIEVDAAGAIVWSQGDLEGVWDADRLANGNTLITQRRSGHRVFEVDRQGNVVFEIKDLTNPSDADRLPNGNTIVAEDGRVREFDRFGNVVWKHDVSWSVEVNRY